MSRNIKTIFLSLCFILFSPITMGDPWLTGPIIAGAGQTIPRGHTNLEVYAFDTFSNRLYTNSGHLQSVPLSKSFIPFPILTHGFTDWMDIQVSLPYVFNSIQGANYNRVGDVSVGPSFQLLLQSSHPSLPDVRLSFQETFPTGKFEQLNPMLFGSDSTGLGSYRATVNLNFQYLAQVLGSHYLRSRLSLAYINYSIVQLQGFNSFGGTEITDGTVRLGWDEGVDLAFEFTLNQNWAAVMEGYYTFGTPVTFTGIFDNPVIDHNRTILGRFYEAGLAPAIEYNFSPNLGIIGGVWFTVAGRNNPQFQTYTLAINAYW